ncbi:MAG: hypothetical protein C4345_03990, partial [Chloroflexota bacterium]
SSPAVHAPADGRLCPGICEQDLSPEARAEMTLCRTWSRVMERLRELHGRYARVAVFPCSAIQLAA